MKNYLHCGIIYRVEILSNDKRERKIWVKVLLSGLYAYQKNRFKKCNILIADGNIVDIFDFPVSDFDGTVFNLNNCFAFPGFVDVHVHLREPGFSYKETVATGTLAAACGGYTTVFSMPNLNPVPDCLENLNVQLEKIRSDARINVLPYGAITVGEKGDRLSDMEALAPYVAAFSDDGRGVQSAEMMKAAMKCAKRLGKIICAHCEDNSLLHGGCIHDGEFARLHGLPGISSESEYAQVRRDIELARETGCAYHVCHISTRESVELIRRAKAEGVDITCETAPHYLVLCDMDMKDEGRFKMNPPLRSADDRTALIEGICDGTIDMIATDHAPHSAEEKSKGLAGSNMGITGIETAFPVLYTHLVKKGVITLERLVELLNINPSKRFGVGSRIEKGEKAGIAVFDLDAEYMINSAALRSMGKSTPFDGEKVFGKHKMTVFGGDIIC